MVDKATLVKGALKATKSGKSKDAKATKVAIVNTPTVKIDHSSEKPHKETPTLRLNSDDLAEIKKWDVGNKYTLTLEVEMVSLSKGNEYEIVDRPSTQTRATFKVKSVKSS